MNEPIIFHIAIKFPNGNKYIEYENEEKKFVQKENINDWILSKFLHLFLENCIEDWIIYNDEPPFCKVSSAYGLSKGIIGWNVKTIIWMRHSVPKYPVVKCNKISFSIDFHQVIYGQSFQSIEIPYSDDILSKIQRQLKQMNVYIYYNTLSDNKPNFIEPLAQLEEIQLAENIKSISKSSSNNTDIYREVMTRHQFSIGFVESCIRGQRIIESENDVLTINTEPKQKMNLKSFFRSVLYFQDWFSCVKKKQPIKIKMEHIRDITNIYYNNNIMWSEKQDNSKWAIFDNDHFAICDINRMDSQYKRGGGMFLCKDISVRNALYNIILH